MSRRNIRVVLMLTMAGMSSLAAIAQSTTPPVVYFTDLTSGPNSGGENNKGVFLTIAGNNFGAQQGSSTVTVGGGLVDNYRSWSNTRIVVQLGPNTKSGNVVVNTGTPSTATIPFTVRTGNIYFVSPTGNDSNAGTAAAPFRTLFNAVRKISAGDTIYVENGFVTSAPDGTGFHCALLLSNSYMASGTTGNPIAIASYPGAQATIGSNSTQSANGDSTLYGLRTDGTISNVVLSGLILRGPSRALSVEGGNNWRVVNTDSSAGNPNATVGGGVQFSETSGVQYYGNDVHDVGGNYKLEHSLYFTTDTNHVDMGWNTVEHNTTCYAVQFHSSPTTAGSGNDQYDLHVHDNVIDGDRCAGLNFATVDPSKGVVEAYNNVFYHTGIGPQPIDNPAYNFTCLYGAGILNNGPAPSGVVDVYNNSFYDCGSFQQGGVGGDYGAVIVRANQAGTALKYRFRNNIFEPETSGGRYFSSGSDLGQLTGCDHNLFFGGGSAPAACTASLTTDPLYKSLASPPDLQLQSGSPAVDAGVVISGLNHDLLGATRPQGSGYDLGAFELSSGSSSTTLKPTAPTNLTGTAK